MTISVDMSEVVDLSDVLMRDAPKQAEAAVRAVTIVEGRGVKSRAQAGAPRDRPWLAQQGIRMKTWRNPEGPAVNVFTVPDPEGRDVGFYVEYGTSRTPPQPFMEPAAAPAEASYPAAVLAAVDPFTSTPSGVPEGGDE